VALENRCDRRPSSARTLPQLLSQLLQQPGPILPAKPPEPGLSGSGTPSHSTLKRFPNSGDHVRCRGQSGWCRIAEAIKGLVFGQTSFGAPFASNQKVRSSAALALQLLQLELSSVLPFSPVPIQSSVSNSRQMRRPRPRLSGLRLSLMRASGPATKARPSPRLQGRAWESSRTLASISWQASGSRRQPPGPGPGRLPPQARAATSRTGRQGASPPWLAFLDLSLAGSSRRQTAKCFLSIGRRASRGWTDSIRSATAGRARRPRVLISLRGTTPLAL